MSDLFFHGPDIRAVFDAQGGQLEAAVSQMTAPQVLGVSREEIIADLVAGYSIEPVELDLENMTAEQSDAKITRQSRYGYAEPAAVQGTRIVLFVPFTGEADLFTCRPSRWTSLGARGRVAGQHVEMTYLDAEPTSERLASWKTQQTDLLTQWIGFVNHDVRVYNEGLPAVAARAVDRRIAKVTSDAGLVASLDVPLRRRDNGSAVPVTRRRSPVRVATGQAPAGASDPVLESKEYEHILEIIKSMVQVMERSPAAFETMQEEHLRTQILVQLNGHYEGGATGETFNSLGKTDILIRVQNGNVFIAECKFWSGPKGLAATIDQLLRYTSWRDTKTAILLFNRGGSLSTVLAKIPTVVKEHPNHVRTLSQSDDTSFRFVMRHRDDPDRHLTLAVLAFEVPAKGSS